MARALYFVVLAALALGVVGVQLDRQAYRDGQVSPIVPSPFRAVAQQRIVETAVSSQEDSPDLLREARDLVRKRPLPASHLLLFAQSAELAGERDLALAALEVAAARGWRDPLPQLAVAQAGIVSGDYASAAPRLAALSATGAAPDQTDLLLLAMTQQQGGQEALAELLTGEGTWKRLFVQRLRRVASTQDFVGTIAMAWDRGATLDCNQIRPAAMSLLRDNLPDEVARIWRGDCARETLRAD